MQLQYLFMTVTTILLSHIRDKCVVFSHLLDYDCANVTMFHYATQARFLPIVDLFFPTSHRW